MRSIICVVAGFVVVMAVFLAGTAAATELIVPGGLSQAVNELPAAAPANFYAANLVVSAMGALLGGWVTARMAPAAEMAHVLALALLVLLMCVPALLGYGPAAAVEPMWYKVALPVLSVGGALLGGWLRSRVVVT